MKSEDSWLTIHGFARLRFRTPFVVTFAPRKNDDVNPISASASTSSTPRPLSCLLEKKWHTKASLSSSSLFFCNVEKKQGTSSYIGYVSEQEKQSSVVSKVLTETVGSQRRTASISYCRTDSRLVDASQIYKSNIQKMVQNPLIASRRRTPVPQECPVDYISSPL
jgi:hypothetical protein